MFKPKFFYLIEAGKCVSWMCGTALNFEADIAEKLSGPAKTKLEIERNTRLHDPSITENMAISWVAEDPKNRSYVIKDESIGDMPSKYITVEKNDVRPMTDDERAKQDAPENQPEARPARDTAREKLLGLKFTDDEINEILGKG